MLTGAISIIFAGQFEDPAKIAAVGLSVTLIDFVIFAFIRGLNSAQETLTSQAFGAGQLEICGTYLHRGSFVMTLFFIPLAITIVFFGEPILLLIGQDPEVVEYAKDFVRIITPGIYFAGLYDLEVRWLNSMKITWVPMTVQVITTCLHVGWCMLFVSVWDFGVYGIAFAILITDFSAFAFVTIYACFIDQIKDAVFWPNAASFTHLKEYTYIAIPSMIMISAENWAFSLMTLLAGLLTVSD